VPYQVRAQYMLSCAASLRVLHLDAIAMFAACRSTPYGTWAASKPGLVTFLSVVRVLKFVQRVRLKFWPKMLMPNEDYPENADYDVIDALNELFGVAGRLESVITWSFDEGGPSMTDPWVWQAKEGHVLGEVSNDNNPYNGNELCNDSTRSR
jgi:hypothetical protein